MASSPPPSRTKDGRDPAVGPTVAVVIWVLGHRRIVWLGVALATVCAALLATQLQLSFSSRDFFATGDDGAAAVAELDALQRRWGADDATLLVLATSEADVRSAAPRRALATLQRALQAMPSVRSTVSIADVVGPTASLDVLHAAPFVPALVAADGRATVLAVELLRGSDDLGAVVPVVARVAAVVAAHDGREGLSLTVAGVPAVRAAFFSLALRDQTRLGPVVAAVVGLALWLAFRRVHDVAAAMLAAGLPLVWLGGAMAGAGEPIGLINQAYFTLIPVIAIADAVHWIVRVDEELPSHGGCRRAAIVAAARGVGRACVWTSLTTGAGFLSLLFVDVAILRRFGLWAAVGVGACWLSVLVVVPLVLSYGRGRGRRPLPGAGWAPALTRWAVDHVGLVVVLGGCALVGAGVGSRALSVDNRLGALLPTEHPVRRAGDTIDRALGGILSLEVEFSDTELSSAALAEFGQWAQRQPQVRWVGAARAQGQLVEYQDGHARLSLHTADIGGQAFEALARRVRARAQEAIPDAGVAVSGTSLVAYAGVNRIATRLRSSVLTLLVVVTAVIGVAMRSARCAALAVPVNVLPLLVGGAVLAALGYHVDPLAAVVVAVALGIAVDDTVHLMVRVAQERRRGLAPREAVLAAVQCSGHAIVVSTVALAAGFAVQMLAAFPPLRLLGGLGAAIVVTALLVDLTVLPAILSVQWRSRPWR